MKARARLIQSVMTYAYQVWGFTYECHKNKLVVQQNKATRLLTNQDLNSESRLKNFKLLSIQDLIIFYSNIYIFKCLNGLNCDICRQFFKYRNTRNTRNQNNRPLDLPNCKLNYTQNSIFFKGVKAWNALDPSIRFCDKLSNFRHRLTNIYLN